MMIRAVNTTSSPTLSTLSTPSTSTSGSGAAGSPSPTLSFLTNSSFPSSSPSISISSIPTASLHPGLGLARPPPLPRAEMDTSPNPNLPNPNSTRPGVIVGATVGSVIGVFIILFAIFWYKGKGCIDRNRPPSKSPADETYTPSPQPMTGPSGSRVSFVTAQTSASRSARSNAPSPPAPAPKPSFSIDLERGNGAHPASPSTLTVHGLGPPQPCALDSEYHGENRLSVDAPMPDPDDSQDHGFAPEWTHAQPPSRSPSRQSISSMTSRISKMSKTSRSRLSATLSRPSTSNQNLRQHYTTTTERLRDRPFSTIYDADSVAWDKDVANIADVSDSESYCEDGRRSLDEPTGGRYPHPYDVDVHNIPEVTVHDPSLHSDSSGTPSPCATVALRADKHKEDNKLTARERMMALYSSSQQNLRLSSEDRERENKYHYTPTHKKRESQ